MGRSDVSAVIPHFVFAGGGTGGHLYPALAVVAQLRARDLEHSVSFFCTDRPIDREILDAARIEAVPLSVQPFSTRPWHWLRFWLRWRQSVRFCLDRFEQRRPAVVVGAGGYASGPPVRAAIQLGIPTFLLNPDALPGRANRHFAGRPGISGILAQWPVTRQHLPPDAVVEVVGCPVRSAFQPSTAGQAAAARKTFGLDPHRPTLLITGASQGARTINEAMMALAPAVSETGWQVLHLSGGADRDRVSRQYVRVGVSAVVLAFTERMAEAMAAADLIVARAGASTLAEILAVGIPSILLPYPYHRDRHQTHNGQVLVEAGAAVMLEDHKDASGNAGPLEAALRSLMTDPARRAAMAESARALGRPQAADRIADRLVQIA